MLYDPIDSNMLSLHYWVKGIREKDHVIVQVQQILQEGIITEDGQTFLFEELTGIELSSEWLIAAGFEAQPDDTYKKQGFPFVMILQEHLTVLFNNSEISGFRFVHELQHFYAGTKQRDLPIDHPPRL